MVAAGADNTISTANPVAAHKPGDNHIRASEAGAPALSCTGQHRAHFQLKYISSDTQQL